MIKRLLFVLSSSIVSLFLFQEKLSLIDAFVIVNPAPQPSLPLILKTTQSYNGYQQHQSISTSCSSRRRRQKNASLISSSSLPSTMTSIMMTKNDDNEQQQNVDDDKNETSCYENYLDGMIELNNDYIALRHGESLANVEGIISSNPKIATVKHGLSDLGKEQAKNAGKDLLDELLLLFFDNDDNDEEDEDDEEETYNNIDSMSDDDYDDDDEFYNGIVVLTSDFLRAKETAEIVANEISIKDDKSETTLNEQDNEAYYEEKEFGSNEEEERYNNKVFMNNILPLYEGKVIIEKRLRERYFGNYDGKSIDNYNNVWDDDANTNSGDGDGAYHTNNNVESVMSVVTRTSQMIQDWDDKVNNHLIVLVAHGDVLQILQTIFQKSNPKDHRTCVEHLETATIRPLKFNK